MSKTFNALFLSGAMFLASCSTMTSGTTQEIHIGVKGVEKARCWITTEDVTEELKYDVVVPETVLVQRTHRDLNFDCLGTEGKKKSFVIEPNWEDTTAYNIANLAVLGVTVDGLSGALYEYPSYITIDFDEIALPDIDTKKSKGPKKIILDKNKEGMDNPVEGVADGDVGIIWPELMVEDHPAIQMVPVDLLDPSADLILQEMSGVKMHPVKPAIQILHEDYYNDISSDGEEVIVIEEEILE